MKGIALFAPDQKSYEQANEILSNEHCLVETCKLIETARVVEEAEAVLADGIKIIIARGRQATAIQKHTKAIVIEICLTASRKGWDSISPIVPPISVITTSAAVFLPTQ